MVQKQRSLIKRRRHDVIVSRHQLADLIGNGISTEYLSRLVANVPAMYSRFSIPKKSGDPRWITAPQPWLSGIQRRLLDLMYQRIRIPPFLYGGLPRRSVLHHAALHVGQPEVMTMDVAGFFPSTRERHVRPVLQAVGLRDAAIEDVLAITMLDGCLPQGAPTSSLLANLAFLAVDQRIRKICDRHDLQHGRFVDDIAVSGPMVRQFKGPFTECIEQDGFQVADKTMIMPASTRQVVTGLVVNAKLRPGREFKTALRSDIQDCLQAGALSVARYRGVTVRRLKAELNGKVNFLIQCDANLGRDLKRRLHGIDWSRKVASPALPPVIIREDRPAPQTKPSKAA